jgi:hypothetical protein
LTSIYTQLLAARVLPIALGLPTVGVAGSLATSRGYIPGFNAQIQAVAASMGIPYYDFYPLTDNGADGWKTNWCGNPGTGDNHPAAVAAQAMGQAVRDLLDVYAVQLSAPNLVTVGNDSGADILWQNGTMVDDANADGIPDGGYVQSATGWSLLNPSGEVASSLVAEPGVVSGNWWRLNKTAFTGTTAASFVTRVAAVTAGMRIGLGFKMKILSPAALSQVSCDNQSESNYPTITITKLTGDLAPCVLWWDFYAPVGTNGLRFELFLANTGVIDFYLGQFTVRQL